MNVMSTYLLRSRRRASRRGTTDADALPYRGPVTRRSWTGDAGLALAIAAVQVAGTFMSGHQQPEREAFDVLAGLLLAAGPAALVVRRRFPAAVLGWAFTTTVLYVALDYPRGPIFFALIAAFFTAVMAGRRRLAWG